MLRTIFLIAVTVLVAIGAGAGSVWRALETDFGFDTVTIGSWTAHPDRGTPQADPYTRARSSREADLSLGHAEGLIFTARRDADGEPLRLSCSYRVEGAVPQARFWTLWARDAAGRRVASIGNRAEALQSRSLLHRRDNTVVTTVSRHPAPGNWLAVGGEGQFMLVLTLYDTAIGSSTRIAEVELPQVLREACE